MNITYESHKPFSVLITPKDDIYNMSAKFRLNCGLVVSQNITFQGDTEDLSHHLKSLFQYSCIFEVRRCEQGVIASAVYFEKDQTRQYMRGTSPREIVTAGLKIGIAPNDND